MTSLTTVGRMFGRAFGAIPGWYMVTVEPFARRSTAVVTAASPSGAAMELHLAEFVQRKHYFHAYERREIAFLHRFLREGDIYVDVGANVGVLVCEGAAAVGSTGLTIAVEPVPDNVARLRANAALQTDARVVVVQAACGSTTGRLSLGLTEQQAAVGNMGSYSASATGTHAADGSAVEVPLRRLDDIVDETGGPDTTVRLLKIDVEGMEADVLTGASALLASGRIDAVLFERNSTVGDSSPDAVLESHGYRVHRLAIGARLRAESPGAHHTGGSDRPDAVVARSGLLRSIVACRSAATHASRPSSHSRPRLQEHARLQPVREREQGSDPEAAALFLTGTRPNSHIAPTGPASAGRSAEVGVDSPGGPA